jgi:hypothetical protein
MKYFCALILVFLLVLGCKKDQRESTVDADMRGETADMNASNETVESTESLGPRDLSEMSEQDMMEFEQNMKDLKKPVEGDIVSFFSTEMWEFSGGLSPGKPYDYGRGEWYVFGEDMTYEFGMYGETMHTGRWTIDEPSTIIRLIPDQPTARESEWKYTIKTNSLVLSGTSTFGNQSTQFKLARTNAKPSQLGFN